MTTVLFFASGSVSDQSVRVRAHASLDLSDPRSERHGDGAGEESLGVTLFRRLVGFVPFIDNVADWLPIPHHVTFEREGRELGVHKRRIGRFRDVYDIDMSGDPGRTLDRRLVLAAAVAMDALQAR
jgi:hypothetical protein